MKEAFSNSMEMIQVTSGPFKDQVGWVWDDQVRRLRVWP
jgi:hypothetical protein